MKRIALIPGDGIGPEVAEAALKTLEAACRCCGACLEIVTLEAGDAAAARTGTPLPHETLKEILRSDAVLKAPVGETAYDVIVELRRRLDLYANIRPAKCIQGAPCIRSDIDLVIVRENIEGIYIGVEYADKETAIALKAITRRNTERLAETAATIARKRRNKATIVHKANVLKKTDGLFRDTARKTLERHGVQVDEAYVDAAAALIARNPSRFDTIVTMNQYGDILSDLAAEIAGGLGLAPSANIGPPSTPPVFEPVHGAAWDIAGKNKANPTAMILSAAMMLEWLGYRDTAKTLTRAIEETITKGTRTPDLGGNATTQQYAEEVAERVCAACSGNH